MRQRSKKSVPAHPMGRRSRLKIAHTVYTAASANLLNSELVLAGCSLFDFKLPLKSADLRERNKIGQEVRKKEEAKEKEV